MEFAFLHHRFKIMGLALLITGIVMNALMRPNLNSLLDGAALLVQFFVLAGLLIIICSKQRTEDEYINHIRLIALQWAIMLFIALRLGWKTVGYFARDESWMPQWQVNSLLEMYLLFFYYRVWLKPRLMDVFNKENSVEE